MNKESFLKKLETKQPLALKSFNYDLLPEAFEYDSELSIKCNTHGVFIQKAYKHLSKATCRSCWLDKKGDLRALTTEDFIAKSKSRFGDKFVYDKTEYIRKDIALTLTCPSHGDIVLTPDQHRWSKHGCPQCDYDIPRIIQKEKVLDKAREIHGERYDYSRVHYENMDNKVEIICYRHGSFWQSLYDHTARTTICPQCSREADKLTLEEFIQRSKAIHGDSYDYGKVKYEDAQTNVIITCKKHGDFTQRAYSHLSGNKCKKCHIEENRLSAEEFIKNAKEVHGNKYDYSKVRYTGNKKVVEIVCPDHGSFWQKPNSHVSGKNGCRVCSESKGEQATAKCLDQYGIEYIREYRIENYRYRYDFYLPKLNIYIEFHGAQHYRPVDYFGGEKTFLKIQERDEEKELLVIQSGGELIVLNYLNLIQGSVEKELIRRLKKIHKYWFVVNGEIQVFDTTSELYKTFDIPLKVLSKNVVLEIAKKIKDFKVLF